MDELKDQNEKSKSDQDEFFHSSDEDGLNKRSDDETSETPKQEHKHVTKEEREILHADNKEEHISFMQRLMMVLTSPKRGMALAAKSPMIIGLLVIFVISAMVIYIPQRPMFSKMTMMAIENADKVFTAEEIDALLAGGANTSMFMSMFYFVFTPLFKGLVAFALAILLSGRGKLKSTMGVVMNAYLIMLIGQFMRMVMVLASGNPYFSISPAMLLEVGQETSQLFTVLSAVDLFAIWYLFVTMIGVKQVHGFSQSKAFLVAFGPFLMMLGLGVAGL
ncbi:Yip1 family protein [Fusibacter sp. JL216-2]|uniref:Yip1 family protein n=1 Tax=Fusibacter sp. JL216-2 TaxID=3071453 RepID=UPI003D327594